MFQEIKNWLYKVIVSSGILLHLLPLVLPFIALAILTKRPSYYTIKDDGGETMKVIKYNGKYFSRLWMDRILDVKKIPIRPDDVMLCGYPKTGSHWTYEILHMMVKGKKEMTKFGKVLHGQVEILPQIYLDSFPSPRVLNSHFRYEDLPEQIKAMRTRIILTVRSPKDAVVSYYMHILNHYYVHGYNGTFENFFKLFIAGEVDCGNYLDYILDWEKVMKTQEDNPILMVEYEKLKKNTFETVKEIAQFLNIDITDEFAGEIVEATRFDNMKAKYKKNKLIRKGQVGDWKNWLSEAQNKQMEQLWKDKMSNCIYQPKM